MFEGLYQTGSQAVLVLYDVICIDFMFGVCCRWRGCMLKQCQVCGVLLPIGSQASAAASGQDYAFSVTDGTV